MKAAGIIAEYNPFHRGHEYHIAETRRITGADYCVVVMSGDFVQRGEPAVLDKYTRAEMALRCGADLVLELPVSFATASAERFAGGGISLLQALGVVETVSCGCETDDRLGLSDEEFLQIIRGIADILDEEPAPYQDILRQQLRTGHSFPASRETALLSCLQGRQSSGPSDLLPLVREILSSPNAILALEYAKAIRRFRSPMKLQLIRRKGSYHAQELPGPHGGAENGAGSETESDTEQTFDPARISSYASATAVRRFLFAHQAELSVLAENREAVHALPKQVLEILARSPELMEKKDFSSMLGYALLSRRNGDLTAYQDMTPDLANRILNQLTRYQNWDQFSELLKTRQITRTHIDRALLHLMLRLPAQTRTGTVSCPYARVLGFRRDAGPLLREIKAHSTVPILTKLADAEKVLQSWYREDGDSLDSDALVTLKQDLFAAELYETGRAVRYSVPGRNEYRQEIIRV